jgi:hypothetical protein
MENKEKYVYPITSEVSEGFEGLTKREYFSGIVLQGILAKEGCNFSSYSMIADISVKIADELLERLEFSEEQESIKKIKQCLYGKSVNVSGRLAFALFALDRISRDSFDTRVVNVDTLIGITKDKILSLRNVSSKTLKELEGICETYGITLKDC